MELLLLVTMLFVDGGGRKLIHLTELLLLVGMFCVDDGGCE